MWINQKTLQIFCKLIPKSSNSNCFNILLHLTKTVSLPSAFYQLRLIHKRWTHWMYNMCKMLCGCKVTQISRDPTNLAPDFFLKNNHRTPYELKLNCFIFCFVKLKCTLKSHAFMNYMFLVRKSDCNRILFAYLIQIFEMVKKYEVRWQDLY